MNTKMIPLLSIPRKDVVRFATTYAFLFFIVLLPRSPFLFRFGGHDASEGMFRTGKACIENLHYVPERPPGSPVYDCTLGVLDKIFAKHGIPYYYYTNLFNIACTALSFLFLYLIFKKYLSRRTSWLLIFLLNFYSHFWVMGGSTTDMNFMILFCVLSYFCFLEKREYLSLFFVALAVGSRIQAIALSVPLFATLFYQHRKNVKTQLLLIATGFLSHLIVLIPALQTYGMQFLSQPYHHDFGLKIKAGAFFLRFGNMFGPFGVLLLVFFFWKQRKQVPLKDPALWPVQGLVLFSILIFAKAPWETFYLLPIVPALFFAVFKFNTSRTFKVAFFISALLPALIQIQFKPWTKSVFQLRPGILQTHWGQQYILRGGG